MKIKDLEWQLQLLAGVSVFDAQTKEALQLARDVIATLRAGLDLHSDSDAAALAGTVIRLTTSGANI